MTWIDFTYYFYDLLNYVKGFENQNYFFNQILSEEIIIELKVRSYMSKYNLKRINANLYKARFLTRIFNIAFMLSKKNLQKNKLNCQYNVIINWSVA